MTAKSQKPGTAESKIAKRCALRFTFVASITSLAVSIFVIGCPPVKPEPNEVQIAEPEPNKAEIVPIEQGINGKKLESGPFICVFNDDGSSQIMYIDSSENEQDKEA